MRKRAGTETNSVRTVQILSVSPSDADHAALREILQGAKPNLETNCRWMVHPVSTVASAAEALAQEEIPIVISDSDTWHAILQITSAVPEPPVLIVTSCSADEQLWAETLNLGAWDVLAKPFDADEVIRAGAPAWRRRQSALDRKQKSAAMGVFAARRVRGMESDVWLVIAGLHFGGGQAHP